MKVIAKLQRSIRRTVTRCVVQLIDPTTLMQTVQTRGLGGVALDGLEHWEQYGFTSRANSGAEALMLAVRGNPADGAVVCIADRRYRLRNLQAGEVAISDDLGNVIHFKRDRLQVSAVDHIEASAPTCQITATTTHIGNVTINGNLVVSGTIDATGNISSAAQVSDAAGTMGSMRSAYNGHSHTEYDVGGQTSTPSQSM